jgi:N-acyl-D-aspartate/D-glutamate deacylase
VRLALLFFALLSFCPGETIIFEHATVIDATGAPPKKDFAVVVTDGRIASVTPQSTKIADAGHAGEIPSGAVSIDASGKFLIPGLWDMHVHVSVPQIAYPLFVANGITGVREMYSGIPLAIIRQWKMVPDTPRIYAPGFI